VTARPPAPSGEYADVETASDGYAARFAGSVGAWFLEEQASATLGLLRDLPPGARVLDVGGGHAQLAPILAASGYDVTVAGSAEGAGMRLAGWVATGQGRFDVVDLGALPYPEGSFDAVLSFRLLAHSVDWRGLLAGLCRVSRKAVVVDYPSRRSVNLIAQRLFGWKKRIEHNTRPFQSFAPADILQEFSRHGYRVVSARPQFLWPMVLHRAHGSRAWGRLLELPGRVSGLTAYIGSPVIARADRRA
jgi:SAM-dependent methyltransferase